MRHLYHVQGLTDFDKLREVGAQASTGDNYNAPESVVLHSHPHSEYCHGKSHLVYTPGKPVEKIAGPPKK